MRARVPPDLYSSITTARRRYNCPPGFRSPRVALSARCPPLSLPPSLPRLVHISFHLSRHRGGSSNFAFFLATRKSTGGTHAGANASPDLRSRLSIRSFRLSLSSVEHSSGSENISRGVSRARRNSTARISSGTDLRLEAARISGARSAS